MLPDNSLLVNVLKHLFRHLSLFTHFH